MQANPRPIFKLTAYSIIGDLAANVRTVLDRAMMPLACVLVLEVAYLGIARKPGVLPFALIAAGSWALLKTWSGNGRGLPMIPILAIQTLVAYGLPIAVSNPTLGAYPTWLVDMSAWEVAVFMLVTAFTWRFCLNLSVPAPAVSYALIGFQSQAGAKLTRLGFTLVVPSTGFIVLQSLGTLGMLNSILPGGSWSILNALASAASTCGFFLLATRTGSGDLLPVQKAVFWGLLAATCLITASGFILSGCTAYLASVCIGLFWGTGRVPWVFLIAVAIALEFLSVGKYTMRDKYWHVNADGAQVQPDFGLLEMPATYSEWIAASTNEITGTDTKVKNADAEEDLTAAQSGQGIFGRINNLQNLLWVMKAEEMDHIPPLYGATYAMIPKLAIPRVLWLWGEKPRSHEGQVLLNVHFLRQDLVSTYSTYVAWGLLAEAYGNFGPFAGSIVLGITLGALFAWLENATMNKMVISMEGFLSFAIFLNFANSFEMVSTVLTTAIVDSLLPIAVAAYPFVHRVRLETLTGGNR